MLMADVREDMRNGLSIAEACQKYNMTFQELVAACQYKKYSSYSVEVEDGIYQRNQRYFIYINGGYCSFFDLDEARYVRDTQPPAPYYLGDSYVISMNNDKYWVIRRVGGIHQGYYGLYTSRKDARKVRDKLFLCNWDKKQLPKIRKELGL